MATPTTSFRRLLPALTLLAFAATLACAQQPPRLDVYDANGTIDRLRLGDDLWIGVRDAAPLTTYELRATAPGGVELARLAVATDTEGRLAPTLLWARSGVVGCDQDATADPAAWRFARYQDAERRHGATLQVELLRPGQGRVVASLAVPAYADEGTARFYLSDGAACPRFVRGEGETLWLSGLHLEGFAGRDLRLYALTPVWPATPPLRDLRPGYQQGQAFTLPAAWQNAPLVAVAEPPELSFWVAVQSPQWEPAFDGPTCLTAPARPPVQSGTGTPTNPICPPCTQE